MIDTNINIDLGEEFCSNFDGTINYDVVEKLKLGGVYANYPAWDWYGVVYFEDCFFKCDIWRYGSFRATISEQTPEELVTTCCERFGYN